MVILYVFSCASGDMQRLLFSRRGVHFVLYLFLCFRYALVMAYQFAPRLRAWTAAAQISSAELQSVSGASSATVARWRDASAIPSAVHRDKLRSHYGEQIDRWLWASTSFPWERKVSKQLSLRLHAA